MKYFDAHAHVQFPPFDIDRESLLQQMHEQEVGALMVGVDRLSSERAVALAAAYPHIYASVGLHPNDNALEIFDIEAYRALLQQPRVVAVGECGLDYYRGDKTDVEKAQKELFEKHIQLALDTDKPLMIHARPTKGTMNAYQDLIRVLESYKQEHGERLRGDIHFFVGGVEEARALIELGFTISYTAVLTFTHDYDEVVRYAPLSSLLSETDCPYVAPAARRGTRNDPLAVIDVVAAIARIRGEDAEMVREQILANAHTLFAI